MELCNFGILWHFLVGKTLQFCCVMGQKHREYRRVLVALSLHVPQSHSISNYPSTKEKGLLNALASIIYRHSMPTYGFSNQTSILNYFVDSIFGIMTGWQQQLSFLFSSLVFLLPITCFVFQLFTFMINYILIIDIELLT